MSNRRNISARAHRTMVQRLIHVGVQFEVTSLLLLRSVHILLLLQVGRSLACIRVEPWTTVGIVGLCRLALLLEFHAPHRPRKVLHRITASPVALVAGPP